MRSAPGILSIAITALLVAGCQPDVGECDLEASRSLYYDEDGFPAYGGQALMEISCASGTCHTQGIPSADRQGAPLGLDFDVGITTDPSEIERLRYARRAAWNLRHAIHEQLLFGAMPPPTDEPFAPARTYLTNRGTPDERGLPSVRDPEGREMLRNWMACGAHVVEAVEGVSQGVGDIVPRIATCPSGQAECDGACVDITANDAHCGGCGVVCGADQTCQDRACVCLNALDACGTSCVDLATNVSHCGACDASCGDRFCSASMCVDSCPAGATDCGGSCVDLGSSVANCGGCGNACGAGETCAGGSCTCAAGLTDCGGSCVDTATDAAHCGGCGVACSSGAVCAGASCGCPDGTTDCGGACVDTNSDPLHCGGCGAACGSGEGCASGMCSSCGPAVSFARDIAPVFQARCATMGCHTGARPAGSLDLSSGSRAYAELVEVGSSAAMCSGRTLVVPGDPGTSYLIDKLTLASPACGTQMPKMGESIPASDLELIRSWICRGAAND